jgi:hypothetical protein
VPRGEIRSASVSLAMSASDLEAIRERIQNGQIARGLGELEGRVDLAKGSGDIESLRAALEVAEWATEILSGRDKNKSEKVAYVAKQNLNFLSRRAEAAAAKGTSPPQPKAEISPVDHRMVVRGHNGNDHS